LPTIDHALHTAQGQSSGPELYGRTAANCPPSGGFAIGCCLGCKARRRWAFSDCNAGATYSKFFAGLADLDQIHWEAIANSDFRDPKIQDAKQAEFLVHEKFPWELVEKIGVCTDHVKQQVKEIVAYASPAPIVAVERSWYY
jgi:ssDNA thymidine ADP-ribosyltransferase, DarT